MAGDFPKVSAAHVCVWGTELRVVEQVEDLASELKDESSVGSERAVLEKREVYVLNALGANIRLGSRVGPVTIAYGGFEDGGIEPLVQPVC